MQQRILLIEDEPGLCLMLRDRLRMEGYGVEVSSDGEQGSTQGYDLILLD